MRVKIIERDFAQICREVENPKSKARNPKQCRMFRIQMTKTMAAAAFLFWTLGHSYFEFVSDFDIRIWMPPTDVVGPPQAA